MYYYQWNCKVGILQLANVSKILIVVVVVVMGEIIIGNPLSHYPQIVERTSLLNVAFLVLSQSTVRNHVFDTTIKMCLYGFCPKCVVVVVFSNDSLIGVKSHQLHFCAFQLHLVFHPYVFWNVCENILDSFYHKTIPRRPLTFRK